MIGLFKPGFEIWRAGKTHDGKGGEIHAEVKVATVSGRAYPSRANGVVLGGQERGLVQWTFACDASVDLRVDDEVRRDGRRLRVRAVPVTGSGRRIQAACEEHQDG